MISHSEWIGVVDAVGVIVDWKVDEGKGTVSLLSVMFILWIWMQDNGLNSLNYCLALIFLCLHHCFNFLSLTLILNFHQSPAA